MVPRAELKDRHYETDLQICTVMWKNSASGLTGLSFFNNHKDRNAGFSTFVMDGATTSRLNHWAVGEKGKGFNLATQYLYEQVEENLENINTLDTISESPTKSAKIKPKISFRVGNKIGELAWRIARYEDEQDLLRVTMDDLSPVTVGRIIARQGLFAKSSLHLVLICDIQRLRKFQTPTLTSLVERTHPRRRLKKPQGPLLGSTNAGSLNN